MSRDVADGPGGHGLLEGKVVLVTAAAGAGIGQATARRCLEEGASVIVSDRHPKRLAEVTAALNDSGAGRVVAIECDVTDGAAVEALWQKAEDTIGPVDVAVNNAGLGGEGAVVDMSDDEWLGVLDVSLNGTFRCTRAAMRRMVPRRRGSIVNLASVTGWRAEQGQAHYGAAKAGVMALTRCAAVEAAPYGVRVNAVAPTLALHPFLTRVVDPAVLTKWTMVQPQRRAAHPVEVANVVIFLASEAASYLTGEVLSVGGQHP